MLGYDVNKCNKKINKQPCNNNYHGHEGDRTKHPKLPTILLTDTPANLPNPII